MLSGKQTHDSSGTLSFTMQKISTEFRWYHPQRGMPTAGGVGTKLRFSTGQQVSGSDALLPKNCVYTPQSTASTTVHWRRNMRGHQQCWW